MHILVIPSWYPHFHGDVGGSFFREQTIALKKNKYSVGVIYPQVRSLKDLKGIFLKPYGIHKEIDEFIPTFRYHTVNFFPKFHKINKARWIKMGIKLFDEYISKYGKPDIIHAHSLLNASYLANEIYKKYGIPFVITEHSSAFARGLVSNTIKDDLTEVIYNAKKCLAVSKVFCQYLERTFKGSKWMYIPNIVNNDFLKFDFKYDNQNFEIINVCFLNENKRVDILLKAFAQALLYNPNMILKIGGDGPDRIRLENIAEELKISQNVNFLGMLSREQVKFEISKASTFILSSEYETFGVVLIEALALGKPVIATKCGGPESIIVPEVGYLVEKNSVDDLAKAIIDLYDNYTKFNQLKIREYCKENFSEEAIVNKLTTVYQNVIRVISQHE